MAEISAAQVKALRDKTGAGMMDCKKALAETGGDADAAIDWLRSKGLSKAAGKADRVASEGLVGVALASEGAASSGAVIEVNAETDFVARNELFQAFVRETVELAHEAGEDVSTLLGASLSSGDTVEAKLTELIATIGENMNLRRVAVISVEPGAVAAYVHGKTAEGLGKIGVLVGLQSEGDRDKLNELGRKIAMHIAAAHPLSTRVEDLDPAVIAKEREIFAEQARETGKPDNIIEKMVEGRLRKFYEEAVLLEQTYVVDGETKVKKVLEDAAKDVGAPVEITGFVRFALGEGVEKAESDFAAEVASMTSEA